VSARRDLWLDRLFYLPSVLAAQLARRSLAQPGNFARLPRIAEAWDHASMLPVPYHYYQPIVRVADLPTDTWTEADPMHGIDMRVDEQLALLARFRSLEYELLGIADEAIEGSLEYHYNNPNFGSGDAEALYCMIRLHKPCTLIEIGSGFSTRLARRALDRNKQEGQPGKLVCVEPYEMPWLEQLGVDSLVRQPVETLDEGFFLGLGESDVLFIDSSHVIRTGGDVNHIFRRIVPALPAGVLVHVHDVFLPFEYPQEWVDGLRRFFTEQYLLQAFLAFNSEFEIVLALNYLANFEKPALAAACPVFARQPGRVPGSFWFRRARATG
jgi:Methyltransferase domain